MDPQRSKVDDDALFALARRQHGVVHYDDLATHGLSRTQVRDRLASHRLTRVHRGVYAWGHDLLRDEGTWLAALFACGVDAVLSHLTAAAYHRWRTRVADEPTHVTVTGAGRTRPGIVVHRTAELTRRDVHHAPMPRVAELPAGRTGDAGEARPSSGETSASPAHPRPLGAAHAAARRVPMLRVTTMPRTLVDLADVLEWDEYRAVADALPVLPVRAIRAAQERAPNRRGAPLVRRLVEADDAHTKSEFERRYLRFVRAMALPRPDALNEMVAGHKADCVYRTGGRPLVVELDGRAVHRRRAQMRADRRRDSDYQLAGCLILRLVWDDLHPDAALATASRLRAMLAAAASGTVAPSG